MNITANTATTHAQPVTMTQAEKVATILKYTYGIVPIVAGADKFMHLLTDWNKYLAPQIANMLPMQPGTFMNIVGVIEIIAGIIVLARPRIGSLIVAIWLVCIALNLLMTGQYFDVAVRDVVIAIGSFCLYLLTTRRHA